MAIDLQDEILQDFLVEAGEILDQLGEQLVELERRPGDRELLDAVFRGFHTIKGGAGFVNLGALVEVCHRAEDVFNILRQGGRQVDAELMDVILQVLDTLNGHFSSIRNGDEPNAADRRPPGDEPPGAGTGDEGLYDDAPEALVRRGGAGQPDEARDTDPGRRALESAGKGQDITEEEFEDLLNRLHGEGGFPGQVEAGPDRPPVEEGQGGVNGGAPRKPSPASGSPAASGRDKPVEDDVYGAGGGDQDAVERPLSREERHQETTIRVDTKRLDDIMNLVGELVLVRNRLSTLRANVEDEGVDKAVSNLDLVTSDLQTAAMKTRMQPIKKVFGRFPRVLRDIARSLRKEVTLELVGEETDLDKNLVEALADPLVHLVRNAVDHGIELPEDREAAGKPRQGTIVLSAKQAGDHIQLAIEDDGAGMDAEVIRGKAVQKGIVDEETAARLDRREVLNLIFVPGFSTKDQISDVSGRGVGMDVVKNKITELSGTIDVDSEKGNGTSITIRVPLTLAILPTLMVVVGNQIFALPLSNVSEILDLDLSQVKVVGGKRVILIRDAATPVFYLRDWFSRSAQGQGMAETGHVVIVRNGNQRIGFIVDRLIGQEEVVIKPLGAMLKGTRGLAGATITGDGRIALVLDVPSLVSQYTGT